MTVKEGFLLVATVSLFVASNSAIACQCKVRPPFEVNYSQIVERYGVIMVGEIVSVTPDSVTVLPLEVLKGKIREPLIFENADTSSGCNYFGVFKARVGDSHLFFYGGKRPKTYQKTPHKISMSSFLSVCSYSGPAESSADKLEILRAVFWGQTQCCSLNNHWCPILTDIHHFIALARRMLLGSSLDHARI